MYMYMCVCSVEQKIIVGSVLCVHVRVGMFSIASVVCVWGAGGIQIILIL